MSRYEKRFAQLKAAGQKAFIPFTLLGWPQRETSLQMVKTMISAGASALELGLAFSDPAADGPIIQAAAGEVIANGFRVDDALALLKEIRALDAELPIGLLVYYNLVLARGVERFFTEIAAVGVDGVLIPDLPPELAQEAHEAARRHGIDLIFIVSPLTDEARLQKILARASGFLYVVSRLGITGVEARYDDTLSALLQRVRQYSSLPACVGFGISTPAHARQMLDLGADGVITGSAVIQCQQQNPAGLESYLKSMVLSCCT